MEAVRKIIYITPVPKEIPDFFKGTMEVNTIKEGSKTKQISRDFEKSFFPGVTDEESPVFDKPGMSVGNKWTFAGTSEELDNFVKGMKLTYPGRPEVVITKADIRDPADPFFSHSRHNRIFTEGHAELLEGDVYDEFVIKCFLDNPDFIEEASGIDYELTGAKYLIRRSGKANQLKTQTMTLAMKAMSLHKDMDYDTKETILKLFDSWNPDMTSDDVDSALYFNYVTNTTPESGSKITPQQAFISLASDKKEVLTVKLLVKEAMEKGVIQHEPNRGYMLADVSVGIDAKTVVAYFVEKSNAANLRMMMELLGRTYTKVKSKDKKGADDKREISD